MSSSNNPPKSPPTPEIDILDEIFTQLDADFHDFHNGSWDFSGLKPIEKAKTAILKDFIPKSKVRELLKDEPDFPDHETQWVIDGRNQLRTQVKDSIKRLKLEGESNE